MQHLRKEYSLADLDAGSVAAEPIAQFRRWFDEALASKVDEPNAMTLSTADAQGRPSSRVVLLKGVDERGFVFYTNYESRKGRELASNPWASLAFFWAPLERQVRIEGRTEKIPREESLAYFQSRPRLAQIGAWASRQSETLPSRAALERRVEEKFLEFGDGPVPLPPFWGGYLLRPDRIEFWQGRPSRLHDRLLYRLEPDGAWSLERLSP